MSIDSNPPSQPLYFDCHMCGECCSSWNIPIEAEKAKRLLEKDWVRARLAETNRELTRMTPETYRIPLTNDNMCVFLAEDRRCLVEANEGLALKPHECQRFPFATVRLPDGTDWHETSAACKSISEKLLLAFQPIQPKPPVIPPQDDTEKTSAGNNPLEDLQDLQAALEPLALFPARIPVTGFRSLSKEQYKTYQQRLREIFTIPDIHPEAALLAAHHTLKCLSKGKNVEKNGVLPDYFLKATRFQSAMARLMTIVFLRKPYRTMSWVNLSLGRTYPDPRLFGLPVELRQQEQVAWQLDSTAQLNRRLNAFLFNLLQRKRLIALGSSLSAQLAMAGIACLLVQWYAKTLAWLQTSPSPSETDLSSAIRLVERYYSGHQPRFLDFFTSRWRGELVAAMLYGRTG